jgi:hypothetical protein
MRALSFAFALALALETTLSAAATPEPEAARASEPAAAPEPTPERASTQTPSRLLPTAAAVVPGNWNPLFDAAGQPTALTRSALAFCRDYQAQLEPTLEFTRALAAAQLLVEHRADVTLKDGQQLSLSGFKVIDETKFSALPNAEFCRWRSRGWLPWVYAHFASVGAWSGLMDRMVARQ